MTRKEDMEPRMSRRCDQICEIWKKRISSDIFPKILQAAEPFGERFSVDIVIPLFEKLELAKRCIQSVLETTNYNHHLILLDDASPNDALGPLYGDLRGHFRVTLARHLTNQGFLPAACHAAALGSAPFILFLNMDTEVISKHWLEEMIPTSPQVAVTGAKLLFPPDHPNGLGERIQHAGVARNHIGTAYHIFLGWPKEAPEVNQTRRVNCVTGGCLLTRRAVWDELGGFDPAFGSGILEDVDYCWAVRDAGYEIEYIPEAVLYHWEHCGTPLLQHGPTQNLGKNVPLLRERWGHLSSDEFLFIGEDEARGWHRARQLMKKGSSADSLKTIKQVHRLAPRLPEAHAFAARMFKQFEYSEDALQSYQDWIRLEPANALPYHELTLFHMSRSEWAQSIRRGREALAMAPDIPQLMLALCQVFALQQDWPSFENEMSRFLVLYPALGLEISYLFKNADLYLLKSIEAALAGLPNNQSLLQFQKTLTSKMPTVLKPTSGSRLIQINVAGIQIDSANAGDLKWRDSISRINRHLSNGRHVLALKIAQKELAHLPQLKTILEKIERQAATKEI
jgi:GT2 family glycosyltransferase